jgi:hypothetical protein
VIDPYVWAELVDGVMSWEAVEADQRARAERSAHLAYLACSEPRDLRELAAMTSGLLAEALLKLAAHFEANPRPVLPDEEEEDSDE